MAHGRLIHEIIGDSTERVDREGASALHAREKATRERESACVLARDGGAELLIRAGVSMFLSSGCLRLHHELTLGVM